MAAVKELTKWEYLELLKAYRDQNSSVPIPNRFPWHSQIASTILLESAKEGRDEVRILTGASSDQFYSTFIPVPMQTCAESGCQIRILVWNYRNPERFGFLRDLECRFSNLQLRWSNTQEVGQKISHFLLVGTNRYRLERPHDYRNDEPITEISPECLARINFNDSDTGRALAEVFDMLWARTVGSTSTR
ncbi:MAG TPA: hypothetical protein VHP11_01800 [Tepidisphaeraceae bacterium]|nr:hypothetical protein [Tepidisphaeraceae bacterium]